MKRIPLAFVVMSSSMVLSSYSAIAEEDLNRYGTFKGSEVSFSLPGGYANATLTIVGPDGYRARNFSKDGKVTIDLIKSEGTVDGIYNYEINAASVDEIRIRFKENNGRDGDDAIQRKGAVASGALMVQRGLIVPPSGEEK